jgi:hypothetical protein
MLLEMPSNKRIAEVTLSILARSLWMPGDAIAPGSRPLSWFPCRKRVNIALQRCAGDEGSTALYFAFDFAGGHELIKFRRANIQGSARLIDTVGYFLKWQCF